MNSRQRTTLVDRLPGPALEPIKQGMDAKSLEAGILSHLEFTLGELPKHVDSEWEPYVSVALAVRDRLMERWIRTQDAYYEHDAKRVYYMSLEFLMGRTLGNSLINLGLLEECREGRGRPGLRLRDLREAEWDAGLGNGGLGRLAACFLDSLATLELPSYGYGIRYDYGIFHQRIVNGAQVETPDGWLRYGNPWEIARTGDQFTVKFYGRVHQYVERPRQAHHGVGRHRRRAGDPLRHPRARVPERNRQHAAAVVGARRPRTSTSATSTTATTNARSRRRPSPRTSPRSCTPTTASRAAGSCA